MNPLALLGVGVGAAGIGFAFSKQLDELLDELRKLTDEEKLLVAAVMAAGAIVVLKKL